MSAPSPLMPTCIQLLSVGQALKPISNGLIFICKELKLIYGALMRKSIPLLSCRGPQMPFYLSLMKSRNNQIQYYISPMASQCDLMPVFTLQIPTQYRLKSICKDKMSLGRALKLIYITLKPSAVKDKKSSRKEFLLSRLPQQETDCYIKTSYRSTIIRAFW